MKKLYFLSFFLLFAIFAQAQTDLKKIVPPNPNVASLFKSVITPVSEYSGLPNVSIPLYTASEGGISVPISLSYATGGIQISEESGIVGLGWAMNAGGAITRTINGVDDFKPIYGYVNNNKQHPDLPSGSLQFGYWRPDIYAFVDSEDGQPEGPCHFLVDNQSTEFALLPRTPDADQYDYMPDVFHFNFNGYSGSFVFDLNRKPFLLHKKGIEIEALDSAQNWSQGFRIITEDGTIYEFEDQGMTTFPFSSSPSSDNYISSWHLSRIFDIYGNVALFNYDASQKVRPLRTFSNSFISTKNSGVQSYSYAESAGPISETDDIFLTSIDLKKANTQKTQEVRFNYSDQGERLDINSKYLESIEVLNAELELINKYDFAYCYFGNTKSYDYNSVSMANGDFAQSIGALETGYPDLNLRLQLQSVTENSISKHAFEYYQEGTIPNKTTLSQDYWGFYNGEYNTETFIPYAYGASSLSSIFDQEKKANRLPSESFAKTFSLKSIQYPTKGKTYFDYELNTYDADANGTIPLPTSPKSERASRVSAIENDLVNDEVVITPNQFSPLKLTFSVTFTGWDAVQYPNSKPPPPDFQEDFWVEILKPDGSRLGQKHHISQTNPEWDALTPEQNANYQGIIQYQVTEEWFYDSNSSMQLNDSEYTLVAHFNSHNGLYKGSVDIHAQWDDVDVNMDKQYSVGGGLRVSSISDYDNDGELETKREYSYHYQEEQADGSTVEKSFGKIKTLPNFNVDQISVLNIAINHNGAPDNYAPVPIANATSHNTFSKDAGAYVGYDQVEIRTVGNDGDNGRIIKRFHNETDHFTPVTPSIEKDSYHKFPPLRVPHNGLLLSEEVDKRLGNDYITVSKTVNSYEINGIAPNFFTLDKMYETSDRVISAVKELPIFTLGDEGSLYWFCDAMKFQLYPYYSTLTQQIGTTQTIWDTNGENPVTTIQEFKYENPTHLQRTESKLVNSKGEEVITKTFYADDIASADALDGPDFTSDEMDLINSFKKNTTDTFHRIAEPIQVETTVNGEKTIQRTSYQDWDNDPSAISYKIWPLGVKTLKGNYDATDSPTKNLIENRLNYHKYDEVGNPLEVSKEDGTKISYIWGYDMKYPIAKIENSDHATAENAFLNAPLNGSANLEDFLLSVRGLQSDDLKKPAWEDFNESVRSALSTQMVSTYTYDPLVGVTSVTDPRGYTIYYIYDTQNRLKEVRDAAGDLVTDYEYHYKGQASN